MSHTSIFVYAYKYALEYIAHFMKDRKCDPLIITTLIIQLIRSIKNINNLNECITQKQIYVAYTHIFNTSITNRSLYDSVQCWNNLIIEYPIYKNICTQTKNEIYNKAFNILSNSDPDVYETTGYIIINTKINPIVKELAQIYIMENPDK